MFLAPRSSSESKAQEQRRPITRSSDEGNRSSSIDSANEQKSQVIATSTAKRRKPRPV